MTPAYFKVVGLKFSDKASTYGLAVALAACTGQRSLLAAAYSLAFGFLYSVPGPGKGLQAIGLPLAMRRAIGGILIPLLDDNVQPRPAPPSSPRGNGYADEGGFGHAAQAMGAGAGNGGARPAPAGDGHIGLGPVPEAAVVDRVVSMGFDRDAAILALRQAWGNEGRAVEILLGGGGG